VKQAMQRDVSILQVAKEYIESGELKHKDENRLITFAEVDTTLGDLRNLTEGGVR
jgi:hypothetical protein